MWKRKWMLSSRECLCFLCFSVFGPADSLSIPLSWFKQKKINKINIWKTLNHWLNFILLVFVILYVFNRQVSCVYQLLLTVWFKCTDGVCSCCRPPFGWENFDCAIVQVEKEIFNVSICICGAVPGIIALLQSGTCPISLFIRTSINSANSP